MLAVTVSGLVERLGQPLVIFGLLGQCLFMARFLVQWLASERRRRSYVPVAFWYISLAGGLMLMTYGILDEDPVIMFGQALGLTIYTRNLVLIHRRRRRAPAAAAAAGSGRAAAVAPPGRG